MKVTLIALLLFGFCSVSPACSQQQSQNLVKPSATCENQENALASGAYVDAVMDQIWPPAFPHKRGITLAVPFSSGAEAFLHTDGDKYELWLGIAQVPGTNVWAFLGDVADSCRLPADPADAVKLLNIHWESRDLNRAQFDRLHGDFLAAFVKYAASVKERAEYSMSEKRFLFLVDASDFTILYDNTWQHFEIEEWDYPINGQTTPMIKWVREFQSAVEQTFHGKFVRDKGWITQ